MKLVAALLAAVCMGGCRDAPAPVGRISKAPARRDNSAFKAGVEAYLAEAEKAPANLDWSHFDAVMMNPDQLVIDSMGRMYTEVQRKLNDVRHNMSAKELYLLYLPYFMAGCRLLHYSRLESSPLSAEEKQTLDSQARVLLSRDPTPGKRRRWLMQPLLFELCRWIESPRGSMTCLRQTMEWLEAQLIAIISMKVTQDSELSLALDAVPRYLVREDPQVNNPRLSQATEKYILFHRLYLDPPTTSLAARDKAATDALRAAVESTPNYMSFN